MTSKAKIAAGFSAFLLSVGSAGALAGNTFGNLSVGMVTQPAPVICTSVGVSSDLNFGSIEIPANGEPAATYSAQTSIDVACSVATPYSIDLDNGMNFLPGGTTRLMKNGGTGASAPYQIFRDDGHFNVWGTGFNPDGGLVSGTMGLAGTASHTVYGSVTLDSTLSVPDASNPLNDTVKITVTY